MFVWWNKTVDWLIENTILVQQNLEGQERLMI